MYDMNKLTREQKTAVIRCLVEGNSIRSTVRITGVAKNSIQKLTREIGEACLEFQDSAFVWLPTKRVQCDEIWNFCYCKEKNVPDKMKGEPGIGSMWTWTAMDTETKLIFSWKLGARDAETGNDFMLDVSRRLSNRVQMTTDGLKVYLEAVEGAFGCKIDFAQVVKQYGSAGDNTNPETRYSPGKCLGAKKNTIMGSPDEAHVSTSYAERQNLNIRMQNRRFTRLTNAFSKKAEMLAYSIAITFMYHNFVRVHQTLKTTPAIAAGVAKIKWKIEDIVDLLPVEEPKKRGPYKKRAKGGEGAE